MYLYVCRNTTQSQGQERENVAGCVLLRKLHGPARACTWMRTCSVGCGSSFTRTDLVRHRYREFFQTSICIATCLHIVQGPELQRLLQEYDAANAAKAEAGDKGAYATYFEEFWDDAYLVPKSSVVSDTLTAPSRPFAPFTRSLFVD